MIDFRRWRRRWTSNGAEFSLFDAPTDGLVNVATRVAPMRSVRMIVDHAVAELRSHGGVATIVSAERFTTMEGEHAALVAVRAMTARGPIQRRIGIVFADDFQAVIDAGFVADAEPVFVDFVDAVVRDFPLLASRQARRCEFMPPAHWAVRSRGLLTHAFAPSYPVDGNVLSVFPGEPADSGSLLKTFVHEDILQRLKVIDQTEQPVAFRSGLSGRQVAIRGEQDGRLVFARAVVLTDGRYRYVVRIESRSDVRTEETLLQVAETVKPIPIRSVNADVAADTFAFFVD